MTEYKWRQLVEWLKNYYIFEYTDIDSEFKNSMIDYIVEHNAEVFTEEDVTSFDGCIKCGLCCKTMKCPHCDKDIFPGHFICDHCGKVVGKIKTEKPKKEVKEKKKNGK